MIERRATFSLLSACLLLAACGPGGSAKPNLPASVSPGWKLASFDSAAKPGEIAGDQPDGCWKAAYTGTGTADVWVCHYHVSGSAFDAAQRSRAEAQAVKFDTGNYLVLVKWNAVPKVNLTALIREIQKSLKSS